jgi:hypothetical protein
MSLARKLAGLLNSDGKVSQDKFEKTVFGPAFSAYLSANQGVSSGVATKVALNTEVFDTDNAFNTTTNRFQPLVAGYYMVSGRVSGAAASGGTVMSIALYKNGSFLQNGEGYIPPSGSSSMTCNISGVVYLNGSTDYIELWATNTGSGTNTFSGGAGVTFFQGVMVRAA